MPIPYHLIQNAQLCIKHKETDDSPCCLLTINAQLYTCACTCTCTCNTFCHPKPFLSKLTHLQGSFHSAFVQECTPATSVYLLQFCSCCCRQDSGRYATSNLHGGETTWRRSDLNTKIPAVSQNERWSTSLSHQAKVNSWNSATSAVLTHQEVF